MHIQLSACWVTRKQGHCHSNEVVKESESCIWPCWSFVRAQHQWNIPLSSSVLTFCSHLRFNLDWRFGIMKMLQSCHISLIKLATCFHKMESCWLSFAQQLPGSQECKSMQGTIGLASFCVPWSCRVGTASCQWSGTNSLGTKHKSKVLIERRWAVSWEEHPQMQPCCGESLSLRVVKECSH